jgi:hypothetical protein|nr:MAG TPA: hypothetical protein [Caudoviricetes sp.]
MNGQIRGRFKKLPKRTPVLVMQNKKAHSLMA